MNSLARAAMTDNGAKTDGSDWENRDKVAREKPPGEERAPGVFVVETQDAAVDQHYREDSRASVRLEITLRPEQRAFPWVIVGLVVLANAPPIAEKIQFASIGATLLLIALLTMIGASLFALWRWFDHAAHFVVDDGRCRTSRGRFPWRRDRVIPTEDISGFAVRSQRVAMLKEMRFQVFCEHRKEGPVLLCRGLRDSSSAELVAELLNGAIRR